MNKAIYICILFFCIGHAHGQKDSVTTNDTLVTLNPDFTESIIAIKPGTAHLYSAGHHLHRAGNQFTGAIFSGLGSGCLALLSAYAGEDAKTPLLVLSGICGFISTSLTLSASDQLAKAGKALKQHTTDRGVGMRIYIQ